MIKKATDKLLLQKAWNKIFSSTDPFQMPFKPHIDSFLLFYPTFGSHLEKIQFKALMSSLQLLDEEEFAISIIEYEKDIFDKEDHWICKAPTYQEYLEIPLVLENSIYSLDSKWGLTISHEDHAILGGSEAFIQNIKKKYPNWKKDWIELKKYWEGNPNSGWIDVVSKKIKL